VRDSSGNTTVMHASIKNSTLLLSQLLTLITLNGFLIHFVNGNFCIYQMKGKFQPDMQGKLLEKKD